MKLLTSLAAMFALTLCVNAEEKKPADAAAGAAPAKPKPDPAAMFAKKDTNSDGKLSKEEFMAKAKDAAKTEAQFTAKDTDKDGSVSKEEYMAHGGKKK